MLCAFEFLLVGAPACCARPSNACENVGYCFYVTRSGILRVSLASAKSPGTRPLASRAKANAVPVLPVPPTSNRNTHKPVFLINKVGQYHEIGFKGTNRR